MCNSSVISSCQRYHNLTYISSFSGVGSSISRATSPLASCKCYAAHSSAARRGSAPAGGILPVVHPPGAVPLCRSSHFSELQSGCSVLCLWSVSSNPLPCPVSCPTLGAKSDGSSITTLEKTSPFHCVSQCVGGVSQRHCLNHSKRHSRFGFTHKRLCSRDRHPG